MIEKVLTTGDTGRLKVIDNTDDSGLMTADMWVQSLSPVSIPQLPWSYSIDGNRVSWKAFNFKATTMWQKLGTVYVGKAQTFILHLGVTGTSHLQGPTDLEVSLFGYQPGSGPSPGKGSVNIKVDGVYKKAIPYVNDNGVWKQAQPLVRTENGWKEL